MVSRVHKRTVMYRSRQRLRSITNSRAHRKTSVILDASEYIRGLKQRLQELNQLAVAAAQKFIDYGPMPMLKVEPQEEGIMIKVLSQRSCQGLLVFILEAFEELGLEVLQARVSCVDCFCLEAVGIKENDQDTRHMDAQVVEQVVSQAIQNWSEDNMATNKGVGALIEALQAFKARRNQARSYLPQSVIVRPLVIRESGPDVTPQSQQGKKKKVVKSVAVNHDCGRRWRSAGKPFALNNRGQGASRIHRPNPSE